MKLPFQDRKGFTLIELMMTVSIIGVMASIALPKFANLVVKAKEAAIKGQLGALRSALNIYYSDNEGVFPSNAATFPASLTGKYIRSISSLQVPLPGNHASTTLVTGAAGDDGRWFYAGSATGQLNVNCTHASADGRIWSRW